MRLVALSILIAAAAYGAETAPSFEQRKLAARLWKRESADWCSRKLQELLAAPTGDMFWMFPVTAIAYLDQGQLSASARQALHHAWQTYMPYRGDTENHFLLYYTSLYLMSQLWPDQEWYTGKSSAENRDEARQWIESRVRITTTRGQGEYDSPHYTGVYLLPLSYLSAWAKDPAIKKRATMMLDYLIADYAPESLNYILYYLVASAYEPPEVLKHIATDRSKPYTHYERKRTRNRWRFNDELNGPVYKTIYVRQEYAVGSDQGGILQPIQEHSWDLVGSGRPGSSEYLLRRSSVFLRSRTSDVLRFCSRQRG